MNIFTNKFFLLHFRFPVLYWFNLIESYCKRCVCMQILTSENDLLLVFVDKAWAFIKDQIRLECEFLILSLLEPNQLLVEGFKMDIMYTSCRSICLWSQLIRRLLKLLFFLLNVIIRFIMVLKIRVFKCCVINSLVFNDRLFRLIWDWYFWCI